MKRRKFSREFKVEAVKLARERGVSVAQAGRDLEKLITPSALSALTFKYLNDDSAIRFNHRSNER